MARPTTTMNKLVDAYITSRIIKIGHNSRKDFIEQGNFDPIICSNDRDIWIIAEASNIQLYISDRPDPRPVPVLTWAYKAKWL